LLVAHDGPEYEAQASLTRYSAAMTSAGRLAPHRVALLAPGDRTEWYSASAAYGRALCRDVLPALREAVPVAGRPVGMGASLGALAMLQAHRRWAGTFGGLFLQSGSFFVPRFDRHESSFPRYQRIVRFVRGVLHAGADTDPVRIALTCGRDEENIHNNRLMAQALAAHGASATLHEVDGGHDHTGWRDAFDTHLTELLTALWGDEGARARQDLRQ
jgi:enterochelin esterase family protein